MNEVVIVIPTLDRPQLLERLVESIRSSVGFGNWRSNGDPHVMFVVDHADAPTMERVIELGADMILFTGRLAAKVNAGVRATHEPLVVFANDDVLFHEGWRGPALRAAEHAAVVGLNDLSPMSAERATQLLVRRDYIEDPGAVWGEKRTMLFEGYHHNFVDDELVYLAKHRGEYAYVPESVVEHLHPSWGKAEVDSTYERGAFQHVDDDAVLFESRRRDWESAVGHE